MPEPPQFAYDYEFHFSSGEPCFLTTCDQDTVIWNEKGVTVALKDKDGQFEGSYNIERERLNWTKTSRRPLEPEP